MTETYTIEYHDAFNTERVLFETDNHLNASIVAEQAVVDFDKTLIYHSPNIGLGNVVTIPPGIRCGFSYGCVSDLPAVHILVNDLPTAMSGTALCAYHSPYDVH